MINIGIIGCGNWGRNYIRHFAQIPGARLVTCCDIDHKTLLAVRERYPLVKLTKNYRDIASDPKIDAVVIATPPGNHYGIARACLLIMDYHPGMRLVKKYIRSGELGRIFYLHSTRTSLGTVREDVSVLWDKAPHDIATLLYLLDEEPVSVAATGQAFVNDGLEDVVFITVRFASGIIANIHVSWLDPCKASRTTIIGEKKMIVFDDGEALEKVKVYSKGVNSKRDLMKRRGNSKVPGNGMENGGDAANGSDALNGFSEFQYTFTYGDVYIPKLKMSEPLRNECLHFLECIGEGKRPLTDAASGARVVHVLEKTEESLGRRGEYVPIETGAAAAFAARESFMAKARLFWKGLGF